MKLFGFEIKKIEIKDACKEHVASYGKYTMHVNDCNKGKVTDFLQGKNPRCGLPLEQCSEGLSHMHG